MTILNEQYSVTHHPNDEQLLQYFDGKLPEPVHDSIQAHLTECDVCLETFRDMRDFFESHRADEEMTNEDRLRSWTALWDKIRDAEMRAHRERVTSVTARSWFTSAPTLAVAALLLIVFGLGVWIVRQRQQQRRLTTDLQIAQQRSAQLQAEHESLEARNRELEQENLLLQEQGGSRDQPRSVQPPIVTKPEINAPSYDIYARNFTQRSGNQDEINRIKVPASARTIVLLLNVDGLTPSPDYAVELVNEAGKTIWRARGLRKGQLGSLTLTMDRSFLGPGMHRLKLYGRGASKAVAEYLVRIE